MGRLKRIRAYDTFHPNGPSEPTRPEKKKGKGPKDLPPGEERLSYSQRRLLQAQLLAKQAGKKQQSKKKEEKKQGGRQQQAGTAAAAAQSKKGKKRKRAEAGAEENDETTQALKYEDYERALGPLVTSSSGLDRPEELKNEPEPEVYTFEHMRMLPGETWKQYCERMGLEKRKALLAANEKLHVKSKKKKE